MKTSSLSMKMLLLTFGSFLILIFGIVGSLYIYFDKYYEPQKINHMVKAINEFTTTLEKSQWTDEQLYSEVSQFTKKQNATMSIDSGNELTAVRVMNAGFARKIPDFFVLDNEKRNIKLNSQYPFDKDILKNKIYNFELANRLPLMLTMPAWNSKFEYGSGTTASIKGALVLYPDKGAYSVNISGKFKTYQKVGVSYTISTIPYTNYKQVNFIKQSTLQNGEKIFTNVRVSLQTANEVMDYLLRFFPFLIGAAVLLSIVMAIVYSKIISKPIVNITKIANRMADMELGITSTVNRSDELGVLSNSLNTLSSNLKNALDDLSQANDQLKEDYENELRQEKARKEFVANVSHELKTPLGIIKSYSEGIRDGVKIEKNNHYIEVVLEEITHMDQMIIEMLEISKFDSGAVVFHKKAIDFDLILKKAVNKFINKASDKAVTLEITGEYGVCLIDEEKIERVLNNLIGNAVKYCNESSVITIRGEKSDQTLTIQIKNECPAYSEEVLSKIWDRFYKADTSHNREIEGTGLGLSITKSILEGHGSSYGAYNTDMGICFYFTLEVNE